jgi:hypothetical protein
MFGDAGPPGKTLFIQAYLAGKLDLLLGSPTKYDDLLTGLSGLDVQARE